ncbi:MAG: RNA methyltransferase [Bacteroidia bacterium]|nr:RNA methyltransferase [Bacteroidia bacterium]
MRSDLNIQHIVDIDIAELEPYRTLRERTWHWGSGHFVAESAKVVRAVLDSSVTIRSMLITEQWLSENTSILDTARIGDAPVFVAPEEVLQRIVGYALHHGVMAVGTIPENPSIEVLRGAKEKASLLVALEGIADAENMGMILRNCAAFGVDGVLVGRDSCSPWLRRSVRVSVGHMFRLHIRICDDILGDIRLLRGSGKVRLVGAVPRGGSSQVFQHIQTCDAGDASLCLLFGSEAYGLTSEATALCDVLFTIPMRQGVDSINVANAVAVALYAATAAASTLNNEE